MSAYDNGSVSTVAGANFRVEDISHKPRRTQAENLRLAREQEGNVENPVDNVDNSEPEIGSVTLEQAIKFFENTNTGSSKSLAVLYENTAMWLRELLTSRRDSRPETPVSERSKT
jgi:hypothetical protein